LLQRVRRGTARTALVQRRSALRLRASHRTKRSLLVRASMVERSTQPLSRMAPKRVRFFPQFIGTRSSGRSPSSSTSQAGLRTPFNGPRHGQSSGVVLTRCTMSLRREKKWLYRKAWSEVDMKAGTITVSRQRRHPHPRGRHRLPFAFPRRQGSRIDHRRRQSRRTARHSHMLVQAWVPEWTGRNPFCGRDQISLNQLSPSRGIGPREVSMRRSSRRS
jgi:hypothetical protein